MSFKRARTLEQIGGSVTIDAEQEPEDAEYREAAGKRFRQYLLERYSTGRATASETCTLAFLHNESGGQGTDDIGLPSEQASSAPRSWIGVFFWFVYSYIEGLWT